MLNILIIKRTGYGHKDYSSLCHINSPLYEESELKWKLKKKSKRKSNSNQMEILIWIFSDAQKKTIREVKEF